MSQKSCHCHLHWTWTPWLWIFLSNKQFLAIVSITKQLCIKMNAKTFFFTFNRYIVCCHSSFIILDDLHAGWLQSLVWHYRKKMFQNCKILCKKSWCNYSSKGDFCLAFNSSCLENVVKCKAMFLFLKYIKGLLSNINILLFLKLCKAFGLVFRCAKFYIFQSYTFLKKKLPFISCEVCCLFSLCL